MNDRHIVERILLPIMMHTTIVQAVDRKKAPAQYDQIMALLQVSIAGPLSGETPRKRDKLLARADRYRMQIIHENETTDELGLTVYFLMKEISESVYQIGEGTELFQAIEIFLAALEHYAEEAPLMRAAEERATVLFARLRGQGLYRV